MPKTSKRREPPDNVARNAAHVIKITTGDIDGSGVTEDGRSRAAVELGRKGGRARAHSLSKRRMSQIARLGGLAKAKKRIRGGKT
jgi:hypothetical protein